MPRKVILRKAIQLALSEDRTHSARREVDAGLKYFAG
jgi:hypothetical protein